MRLKRVDLRGRVNGNLALRFEREGLTSYAGLEFVRRHFRNLGVTALLRRELSKALPPSDFGGVAMIMVVLALTNSGGRLSLGKITVLTDYRGNMDEVRIGTGSTQTGDFGPRTFG